MLEPRLQQHFFDSADLKYQAAESLIRPLSDATDALLTCITSGNKVLVAGDAALSQHLVALLAGQFERERPGLAALRLPSEPAAIGLPLSGGAPEALYAKTIYSLGAPGDVLVLIQTRSAESNALVAATEAAHDKEMTVLALTPQESPELLDALTDTDIHIPVPHERAARVFEVHALLLHALCDALDLQLLGAADQ